MRPSSIGVRFARRGTHRLGAAPLQPQARTFVWHRLPNQCLHGFSPYGILRGISILVPGRSETPMLPMALDVLCDGTEARCDPARIEKERQAVLSEMTMPW